MISVNDKRYPIQGLRSYRKPHLHQRVAPCRGSSPQERAARLGVLRFQHVVAGHHLGSTPCWNVFPEKVTNPCPFLRPSDRLFKGRRRIIKFPDGTPGELGRASKSSACARWALSAKCRIKFAVNPTLATAAKTRKSKTTALITS